MANAKRASMREGPLAALFRKTEGAEDGRSRRAARARAARRAAPRRAAPRRAPARERPAAPGARAARAERRASPRASPRPQERLRHAFSSEIPENMMERAAGAPGDATRTPRRAPPAPPARAGPTGQPVIRVVGVGGAGVNAVNRMVEAEVEGVEFLAVNTDLQSLQQSTADLTLHIGAELTRGLGSGSDADVGRQAAMEDYDRIKALLKGSDMIFITAGAGGGTGTGAAPDRRAHLARSRRADGRRS